MTPTVSVTNAGKNYGKTEALRDVSFELGAGETIALVGHNGAGKTTLIKLMLGLIRPTTGRVSVLGEDPASGDFGVRARLGYLPESVSFHLALTGRETLAFYARLKRADTTTATELFDRVGLSRAAVDRPVRTYSKGMRQRLGLAQALLGDPHVLLLDEPTSGLDPALRHNFYELIEALRAKGTTILLSSHALTELEGRADRVIIVNGGNKIADGTLNDLRKLARLPTRIRVTTKAGKSLEEEIAGQVVKHHDGDLEIEVRQEDKLAVLHRLSAAALGIANLVVLEPTLDELYAHFLQGQKDSR
ncbi:ABC transporter ATP-binding protein [Ensifer sp. 1H6]|uniref:ABC transporter ATP-binding protein n=1 Tax=Ensifer sp. 1H6 TaxID=1911585 RepID=UPI0009D31758|nr:ABC transporter ATP-binding protein [Ensifer sp. 1H6]OMQ46563.1 ABC transporter ATP-binding protein [Ensifer sp. 1H6]